MSNGAPPAAASADRRLSPLDASFLYWERPREPLHVGSVAVLDGSVPFDALRNLLGTRLGALPRYRQRPVRPLLDWTLPTWQDDPGFDPRHHIRRVVLPPPGGEAELHAAVDTLFAIPLDPGRPLWESCLLDGLAGGRAAVLSKVHHCMLDGVSGAQVMEVMTDGAAGASPPLPRAAAVESARRGLAGLGAVLAAASPGALATRARQALEAAGTLAALARTPIAPLPFNGVLSGERRIVWTSFALDDLLAMRGAAGCKVNDVVLAVIAGALHHYLATRGGAAPGTTVRALVPVSVRTDHERLALGNRVSAMFASLPVDTPDPIVRLAHIAQEMRALKERGQPWAMEVVLGLARALPSSLAPVLAGLTARFPLMHTVCTNVPGPLDVRHLLGRRVLEMHPIVPISLGMGLGFAIMSYAGTVSIAATTDPRLVPDAGRLPAALRASADELGARLGIAPHAPAAPPPAAAPAPTVGDLMAREVVTLAAHDSLARAWELMRTRRIRHLPVVDTAGRLIGVVTHRDLLAAAQSSLAFTSEAERVRLLGWASAADVMETHLSTATAEEPAAAAGARMARHKIGCLPVVGAGGRLAGIVTEEDFLRWATAHMATTAA